MNKIVITSIELTDNINKFCQPVKMLHDGEWRIISNANRRTPFTGITFIRFYGEGFERKFRYLDRLTISYTEVQ